MPGFTLPGMDATSAESIRPFAGPHAFVPEGTARSSRSRKGASLVELITATSILSVLFAIAVPAMHRMRDEYAVRAARDAFASAIARTRAAAVAAGGARLVVAVSEGRLLIETAAGDTVGQPLELTRDFDVAVSAGANAGPEVQLRFDGLGIGRVASRTFTLVRGRARARVTVSAYGRVQR